VKYADAWLVAFIIAGRDILFLRKVEWIRLLPAELGLKVRGNTLFALDMFGLCCYDLLTGVC
jgi:hypothetical protein